jgi:cytochrome P450
MTMAVVQDTLITPPTGASLPGPRVPPRELSTLRAFWTIRRNVLEVWPAHYYQQLRVHRRLLGRDYFLLNDPADIDQLLIAHGERYQREPMARRLLQPMVGRGLLLAEGEEWRRQRRTVAPAFQPRHIDRLIPCFHEAAAGITECWNGDVRQNRRLLGEFRAVTLAIAARAMFSITAPALGIEVADNVPRRPIGVRQDDRGFIDQGTYPAPAASNDEELQSLFATALRRAPPRYPCGTVRAGDVTELGKRSRAANQL